MKKIIILPLLAGILLAGCAKRQSGTEVQAQANAAPQVPVLAPADDFVKEAKLCDLAAKYGFKIGACISYNQVNRQSYIKMLTGDFNTTTATNEFKAYSLLNQAKSIAEGKPVMNYTQADRIAQLAQENGIGIRGHVLVWDAYMPVWFFKEGYENRTVATIRVPSFVVCLSANGVGSARLGTGACRQRAERPGCRNHRPSRRGKTP